MVNVCTGKCSWLGGPHSKVFYGALAFVVTHLTHPTATTTGSCHCRKWQGTKIIPSTGTSSNSRCIRKVFFTYILSHFKVLFKSQKNPFSHNASIFGTIFILDWIHDINSKHDYTCLSHGSHEPWCFDFFFCMTDLSSTQQALLTFLKISIPLLFINIFSLRLVDRHISFYPY